MNMNKFRNDGKIALITGAAGLMGYQHAMAMLEAGAKVVLTDISEERLAECKKSLSQEHEEANIMISVMD